MIGNYYKKEQNNLLINNQHLAFTHLWQLSKLGVTMSALKLFVHNHGNRGDNSLIKTITFAMTHFSVAFTVAYLLTGDLLVGSLIAMVEPAINKVAYFFHEKLWKKVEARPATPALHLKTAEL